jgi:hypothetical protein
MITNLVKKESEFSKKNIRKVFTFQGASFDDDKKKIES